MIKICNRTFKPANPIRGPTFCDDINKSSITADGNTTERIGHIVLVKPQKEEKPPGTEQLYPYISVISKCEAGLSLSLGTFEFFKLRFDYVGFQST
jgi:hypothetical protein